MGASRPLIHNRRAQGWKPIWQQRLQSAVSSSSVQDGFFSSSELDEVAGGSGDGGEIRQTMCCLMYDEITPFLIRSYRAYFKWRDTGKADVWWLCAIKATLEDGDCLMSHCRNDTEDFLPADGGEWIPQELKPEYKYSFFFIKDFYFSFYRLFCHNKVSESILFVFFPISLYCSNAVLKQPRKNQRLIRSIKSRGDFFLLFCLFCYYYFFFCMQQNSFRTKSQDPPIIQIQAPFPSQCRHPQTPLSLKPVDYKIQSSRDRKETLAPN